jgi:hypothetical protein
MRKLVVCNIMSLDGYYTEDDTDPWRSTTRIVRRAGAHRVVAELKEQPGREILTFGSRTLWNDLLAAGLVDELHLMVGPAVLGGGTPMFGSRPSGALRLADVRRFDGSDNLVLRENAGQVCPTRMRRACRSCGVGECDVDTWPAFYRVA